MRPDDGTVAGCDQPANILHSVTERETNWAGTITYGAQRIRRPSSLEALQDVVSASTKVRALGSRHSFSRIADTDGELVSLADLPPTVSLDPATSTVTVAAGMRYGEVCRQLHEQGYALHNLGSLPHISMAGAVATATHGSGAGNGSLATAVRGLTMVTADGTLTTVSRESDPELFPGMVVALGVLGIVVTLTLDVVPAFDVRQEVYEGLARDTLDTHVDEILSSAYSVSVFTDWAAATTVAWLKSRTDGSDGWATDPAWMGARPADGARHPVPGMPTVNCTEQLGVPGPWYDRLPHFRLDFTPSNGEEIQSEYLLPREHTPDALRALDRIKEHIAPVLQICEIRAVAADDLWLSPAYEHDVVGFHFTWVKDADAVTPVLGLIERQLAPFGARPHWGKLFTVAAEELWPLYPRLPDFRALRSAYDPDHTFGNAFVDHYLA